MAIPWWTPDVGWNTDYDTCMPNCTVNVWGQATAMGISCPSGFRWSHDFTEDGWSTVPVSSAQRGDIVRYNGSVAIVISGSGNSAICSHSLYTTVSGKAHNYDGRMQRYSTDDTGTTKESVWNYCNSKWPERCHYTHNINSPGYGLGSPLVVFRSGSAPTPGPPQPDPPPSSDWYWDDNGEWTETSTVIVPKVVSYMNEYYECGANNIWSGQSGTQDAPQAPTLIHPGGGRLNERWEPFNMYTDERILTYTTDGQPIWSNWETKYTGSESFLLGGQPTYGNGWEMEWQGDDD